MRTPIYLDYAATTPVDEQVADIMSQLLTYDGAFGNAASNDHPYGWKAASFVDTAREQVAALINADPQEIVFTSGATESNNLALIGLANFYKDRGKHIITMKTEHKAVLDTCKFLEKQGVEVTYLPPGANGLLDIEVLKQALRPDTLAVSIMYVNNETGVTQDIARIAKLVKQNGSFMHVDAVQAIGKMPIDMMDLPVDLLSMTAHKVYGPKGIGALYIRRKPAVRLQALLYGGGQEQSLRPGTLATHQIAGLGKAFELAQANMTKEVARIAQLKQRFWQGIKDLPGVGVNGDFEHSVCGIINVHFSGIDSDVLIKALPQIAVAAGAACSSAMIETSHVLRAMRLDEELAHSSLRFSFGRYTTEQEIDFVVKLLKEKLPVLLG
jgi:cysteine desulfurase